MIEEEEISDSSGNREDDGSLDSQLAAERRARDAADREILALKTEKQALEYRVINANRTLAYGLGRALIEARTVKGFLALPGRIRRLRSKQRAKRRERVPNSFDDSASERLKLVEPALDKAMSDGAQSAADWVIAQRTGSAAQARALAEIAHWILPDDPDLAGSIAVRAAETDASEVRLFSLALRLREAGEVRVPAIICGAVQSRQSLSILDQRACRQMIEDGEIHDLEQWNTTSDSNANRTSDQHGLVLLCPTRWQSFSQIAACRAAAEAAGFAVTIASSLDDLDLGQIEIIHVFATAIGQCCDDAVSGVNAGCRVIIDLAAPPDKQVSAPNCEMASVERARLVGLGAIADQIIVRSEPAAKFLRQLDIEHSLVAHHANHQNDPIDDSGIAAALLEYGVKSDGKAIAIVSTLTNDPALLHSIEACASLDADVSHILIIGKGDTAELARHTEALPLAAAIHFIGLPPPQRWRALLAGIELLLFPSDKIEPLGSEIPAILTQACADQRRILASPTAWDGQGSWQAEADTILPESSDWADRIEIALQDAPRTVQPQDFGRPISDFYEALANQP